MYGNAFISSLQGVPDDEVRVETRSVEEVMRLAYKAHLSNSDFFFKIRNDRVSA
jgi:hypothetical protein